MSYKGSDLGADFKEFFRKEKNRITRNLKEMGCTKIELDYGFYYFSGFFTSSTGQIYYLSCSDVRHFGYTQLMYRTAKSYEDYTGGFNMYVGTGHGELQNMKLV